MKFDTKYPATLIVGENLLPSILDPIASQFNISIKGNPDFHVMQGESLGIDESRSLQESAYLEAFGDKKVFVLSYRTLSIEAQNALLKLFEEPPRRTYFFLIVPTLSSVLPTLRSRLAVVDISQRGNDEGHAKKFLSLSPAKRLDYVAPLIEEKNKDDAGLLIAGLEQVFHDKLPEKEAVKALQELQVSRKYLFDRASSVKIILEHLALTLP